ncbi:MAG TPA: type 2 lanthipeptide synthetase LanM, partial [Actinocrinis sp.]
MTALPLWWWARGLNLRERIDAPRPPAADRVGGGIRSGRWSLGDRAGFAARLADMALSDDLASALGDELPERLGARAPKPGWAHYIEMAVAAAPEEALEKSETREGTGRDAEGAAVFLPALRPLIAPAWAGVAARLPLPESEHDAVRSAFETRLGGRLTRLSARTLVKELNRERVAGRLNGATAQERFAAFTASLGTRQGLALLFTRYPVLGRMLGQTAVYAVEAMVELADRLHADRERLAAELFGGVDPGVLTRLELGCGDAHQGNRSVAILHFAAGSVVYKPRPLDQHALLDEAVSWLNAKVAGLGLRTPRTVRSEGYGWLEFIEHRLCESVTEADRFYWHQGALLALLYAIDGTDVHYENLIACGDQPLLVDAETLLHSGLPFATTAGADPAAEALQASVYRTGLLPYLLIGDHGALDVSAIGRTEGGSYPSDALCWEGAGTDEMRAVRRPVCGPAPAGQNQPLAGSRPSGRADFRAAMLEGFRTGYDAICRHRSELLAQTGFPTR